MRVPLRAGTGRDAFSYLQPPVIMPLTCQINMYLVAQMLLLEISLIEKKKKNEGSQKGLGWLMDSRERKEPVVTR